MFAAALVIALAPTVAPSDPAGHSHAMPPEYLDPGIEPPQGGGVAEYPLAVAFNEASPTNFTAGGIVAYDYIVVHTMQGYYGGSISWFQNPDANVSAHFVIRSEDGEITQMVHLADRAWHVGNNNAYAIGIEHEGFIDDAEWLTWAMYAESARLARWIADDRDIPIDRDHIVGHVELPGTHTDPGPLWDWDLYMALVEDVVPGGVVQGVVVDAAQPCTLTANVDTWLKRTAESSAVLADDDKCLVPAGSTIDYRAAGNDIVGHRVLEIVDAGPCEGTELSVQPFAFSDHYDGFCEAESLAVAGVEVTLGDSTVETDAAGRFVFSGVEPGSHLVEVAGGAAYLNTQLEVDVQTFPGVRAVLPLEPVQDGADSGDDEGADDESGDGSPGDEGGSGDGDGAGGAETGAGTGGGTGEDGGRWLPPALDDQGGSACACRSSGDRSQGWLFLLLLVGVCRRRVRC